MNRLWWNRRIRLGSVVLLALGCARTGIAEQPPGAATSVPPVSSTTQVASPRPSDPFAQAQPPLPTITLEIGGVVVEAEVADDRMERSIGLMHRTALRPGSGMLFVYPRARRLSFWMRNTPLPLSIAFIDAGGTVVRIADMRPLDERHVPSDWPALYALEVPQGWFGSAGVSIGDHVAGLPGAASE